MAKTLESTLRITLIDRVTQAARGIDATLARLRHASESNARAMDAMRGRMLDAVGAGYALWRGLSAPVNAAVQFESAMADVKKVVDFDTPKAFNQMGLDIRDMSLRIPMAADGIAQIVGAAGQSGIAQNELTKFAEIASKVGVAWDMSASDTGEALAKLKTALGRNLADTQSLADAINHLGNNSAASAPQILDVVKRVAPMAKQFGMTAEQVAALGAAMTGSGFESEVAATSILNVGRALTRGAGATGRQVAAFRRLRLSSKDVAKSMQKDAMGTLQNVLTRIDKLPAHLRASAISDIFGDEARALGPLVSNGKLLSETLAMISDKSRYAGSAQREFESASQRTANSLQLFTNRINDLGISIGDALLPALNRIIGVAGPIVTNISQLAQRFPQAATAIVAATSALIGFRVAMTAMRFAGLYAAGGLIKIATGFVSVGSTIFSTVTTIRGATAALRVALISTGVGAILVGIGAAGAWIYENWNGIQAMFVGIGRGIADAFPGAGAVIDTVTTAVGDLFGWIKKLTGPIDATEMQWRKFGYAVGQTIADVIIKIGELPGKIAAFASQLYEAAAQKFDALLGMVTTLATQMYDAGVQMIQSLWDGAVAKFNDLLAWFSDLPARIKNAIGNIDLSGIISWPKLPSWAGGTSDPEPAIDGARASGGPVSAGRTYLVGERGPELFSPGRSGMISPNEVYRSARASAAASAAPASFSSSESSRSQVVYLNPVINIHGITDPKAVSDQVISNLGRQIKALGEAAFSD